MCWAHERPIVNGEESSASQSLLCVAILNARKATVLIPVLRPVIPENIIKIRGIEVLHMRRLPGRLNAEQTAALIGCQAHDIPVLTRSGLLKPLGGGPKNSVKFFSAVAVLELVGDSRWLDKLTRALSRKRKMVVETPDSTHNREIAISEKAGAVRS